MKSFECKSFRCARVFELRHRNARRESSLGSSVLKPCGDQPVNCFLVNSHDLVDLDLLAGNINYRLAKAGNLDAIRDWLAVKHQLRDRHHGVTCVSWVPKKTFPDDIVRDERFRLAWQ